MKPVRKISSYVLLVGVMGLSIVGGIVSYQLYSAFVKTQTTEEQKITIKPIDGVINQTTIDSLKKRTVYSDIQMGLLINATPTPEITGVEETTPTGQLNEQVVIAAPESTSPASIQ